MSGNLTAVRERSGMDQVREISQKKILSGENYLVLTSCLGLHECLVDCCGPRERFFLITD